ncbi:hypothetical protein AeRB84_003476 [Aphanomyces euteiches]|nr:hypothetical protein AeRB84_003476 [Aphanomyces euteiches]
MVMPWKIPLAFVAAPSKATLEIFGNVSYRKEVLTRNTEMFIFEKHSPPCQHNDRSYCFKNDQLQHQSSLLYAQNDLTSEPVVILDPNNLSEDGTFALVSHGFSEGKSGIFFFAYGDSNVGSDWLTIKVLALHAAGTVEHDDKEPIPCS